MNKVSLKSIIGPAFYDVHKYVKNQVYTHYWLKGGRGSLKSSFIGTEIPLGIMRDAKKGLIILNFDIVIISIDKLNYR